MVPQICSINMPTILCAMRKSTWMQNDFAKCHLLQWTSRHWAAIKTCACAGACVCVCVCIEAKGAFGLMWKETITVWILKRKYNGTSSSVEYERDAKNGSTCRRNGFPNYYVLLDYSSEVHYAYFNEWMKERGWKWQHARTRVCVCVCMSYCVTFDSHHLQNVAASSKYRSIYCSQWTNVKMASPAIAKKALTN